MENPLSVRGITENERGTQEVQVLPSQTLLTAPLTSGYMPGLGYRLQQDTISSLATYNQKTP